MGDFNRLFFHPSFNDTVEELSRLNVRLPPNPSDQDMDFHLNNYPQNGKLVSKIEDIQSYSLSPKKGEKLARSNITLCAYDESINKFSGLE